MSNSATTLNLSSNLQPEKVVARIEIPKELFEKVKTDAESVGLKPQTYIRIFLNTMIKDGMSLRAVKAKDTPDTPSAS